MNDLMGIFLVTLIIWVGLFAYVYRLDRKARRLDMGDL
ncbi:MAG: CcmD family protein [Acidobacteria bacterium]|nr:CcmD family protein [Acidobacteriota bacterium]